MGVGLSQAVCQKAGPVELPQRLFLRKMAKLKKFTIPNERIRPEAAIDFFNFSKQSGFEN